ncbi:MAG: MMPL family transporter [Candidatus Dormibacterales bacterium]
MFEAWGRFVHRHRWPVLAASGVLLALSVAGLRMGGSLTNSSPARSGLEYARATRLIASQIPQSSSAGGDQFDVLFSSPRLRVFDPAFRSAVEAALQELGRDPRVSKVSTPYDGGAEAPTLVSRDGRQAVALVDTKDPYSIARGYYPALAAEVRPGPLFEVITGDLAISKAFNDVLESDVQRAELVSLPLSLVLLAIVFGALVAALLPVGVGILAVVGGVTGTLLLARATDVSQYALNIVTLIGLGVAIDYSLFIVNRFREELAAGAGREEAVARTVATAGRAVTFSGLTVAAGLSGMLFFRGTFLASMGVAGGMAVVLAVVYGLTFLVALLSILGPAVDRFRVPLRRPGRGGFWRRAALAVMRRPVLFLVPALAALLVLGYPFLHIRLSNGSVDGLPPGIPARDGYDRLVGDFPGQSQDLYAVVVDFKGGRPLTPARVGRLYDLERRLAALPGVVGVHGVVDSGSHLSRAQYEALYARPPSSFPATLRRQLAGSVGRNIAVLYVEGDKDPSSQGARSILASIRNGPGVGGAQVLVTGQTAFDVDTVDFILGHVPAAIGFVLFVTYVVLFLLTGSVLLPLKAVLVNLLSISAAFGALVFVFQDGHLSSFLGFTAQAIDPTVPVLLFCIVFGLSMDYEVMLVSRIQEEHRRVEDNRMAVAEGLERSGRIITGAAAIMVAVFGAFGLAQTIVIKEVGLGLAIAVAVDATLVRGIIVPAVMRLLGRWNWWAPAPLARLYGRLGTAEAVPAPAELTG